MRTAAWLWRHRSINVFISTLQRISPHPAGRPAHLPYEKTSPKCHTRKSPAALPTRPRSWACTTSHARRIEMPIGRHPGFLPVSWMVLIAAIYSSWNSATITVTHRNLRRTIQLLLMAGKPKAIPICH